MYFLVPIVGLVIAATVGYLLLEMFVFGPRRWRLRWGTPIPVSAKSAEMGAKRAGVGGQGVGGRFKESRGGNWENRERDRIPCWACFVIWGGGWCAWWGVTCMCAES
jgi:hypothetical protein